MPLTPIVIEQTSKGERSYDIFSRLMKYGVWIHVYDVYFMVNQSRLHKYHILQFFWTVSLVQQRLMIMNNGQNGIHVQG